MKKYLQVIVKRHNGGSFSNPLKLSESHLIIKLAEEHYQVTVSIVKCTSVYYKSIFG